MKKRTRILAAALTLIMVIGLLPLSLFAVSGAEEPTEISIGDKSYESVSAALARNRFTSHLYMDFENETPGLLAQAAIDISGTNTNNTITPNSDGKTYSGGSVTVSKMNSPTGGRVEYKNYKQAFSINEENGNKSFYFGSAAKTIYTNHNDNYLDAMLGSESSRGNDLFLSVDFKMGGKNIITSNENESALCFINRDSGRHNTPTVWISSVGGVYLDKTYSPESLVGYLSDTEYTSISVHVKLSENKYYVYINDVLVNPEGKAFMSLQADGTYGTTGKTPDQYLLSQVRIYNVTDNVPTTGSDTSYQNHSGLHADNIILASRAQRAEHNTEQQELFTTELSGVAVGHGIVANENIPGVAAATGIKLSANAALPDKGLLSYVKDGNDTVLKVGKPSGTSSVATEQIYFSLFGLAGYVRKNYSVSIDFKMGSETLGNRYTIIHPKNRSTGSGVGIASLYLEADGRIMCGSKQIGTASTEKYTRLTLDIVWSEETVKMYYYVDGVHMHTGNPSATPWGDNEDAKYLNDIAFVAGYGSSTTNLKENELYVKSINVSLTDGYNSGNNISSPFAVKNTGLVKTAGITRYYNEDGSIKTEDFTVDGVKYIVGFNGNVLGRETDGIEMSYGDYFKSTFTYGSDKNVKLYESLNAACLNENDNSTMTRPIRNAVNLGAKVEGENARYYVSYANSKTGSQDSYRDFGVSSDYINDSTVIFDFDIMLDAYSGQSYGASGLVTTKGLDASGARPSMKNDTVLLTITSDGWLKSGDKHLVPLSKREFTKISAVVRAPETGKTNGTYDIYVNGVLMIENAALASGMYGLQGFRNFESNKQTVGMYVKNISMYAKADRPMQFMTMVGGEPVLTSDQSKTPVKAADLKQGVVKENGISRYYNALGLPVVGGKITVDETELSTSENGKILCGELSHLGPIEKGICAYCGKNADGISALYGNSLIIDSDVKVVFYLEIVEEKAAGVSVEIGRESDFASGNTVITALSDIETETIDGKKYYKVSYGVPAKDISNIIKVRVIGADGTAGGEFTYSAKTYIDTVMAKETSVYYSAELKALLSALDTYGNNASVVLDKLTDGSIDIADSEIDWSKVTEASGSRSEDKIVQLKSFSLELKSNVKLRVYFSFTSGAAKIEDFIFKVNGETRNVTTTSNKYIWCLEETVPAKNLNDTFTFTIESKNGESSLTLNLSALYYAKVMSEQAETEAEKNLMKAIYKYWEKADMYREKQDALTGKKIYSFGDSLVAGHHSGNGMVDGIAKAYGMNYTKYAKNGATVNLSGASVYNQVLNASSICPDFIVFDGLTNDVGAQHVGLNYPIGAITEGFDSEFDTTTFCGSFEATLKLMKEKYPYAKIVFVTPHKMPTRHLEYFKQLVDLATEMCEKWDVTVANVYYDGDMDTTVDELRVKYSYNNTDESEGNGNGTHLTGAGYDIFYASLICDAIIATPAPLGVTVSDLKGASVYSFGDSLIDGTSAEGYGMLYEIVNEYGLDYTEYAIRGSSINLHNSEQTKVIYNQLTAAESGSPDYIIFNGLTNDEKSDPTAENGLKWAKGEISDGFDGPFDTTTFCGSFETILKLMKEKYPDAKIIYVTPHKNAQRHAEGMRELVDAAIQICEKWNVTVADVYNDSGLDLSDEAMKELYGADIVHLNKLGYNTFYAPLITEKMLELMSK